MCVCVHRQDHSWTTEGPEGVPDLGKEGKLQLLVTEVESNFKIEAYEIMK